MNALTDANYGLVFDMVSILVLRGKVSGVYLRLIIEVSHDLYGISGVKHLYIVLIGGNDDSHVAFGGLDEVVLLEAQQILSRNGRTLVHLQVVLVDADGVLVISPNLSNRTVNFQNGTSLALLCSRDDLHSLRLLEPLTEMVDMLLYHLARHFFVLALNGHRRVPHLHHSTVATRQFTCHYLGLLAFLQPYGGNHVLALFLVVELLHQIAAFRERLHLNRKHRPLGLPQLVVAES